MYSFPLVYVYLISFPVISGTKITRALISGQERSQSIGEASVKLLFIQQWGWKNRILGGKRLLEARRKQIKSKKPTGKIKDRWFQFGQYSGQPISLPLVLLQNKIWHFIKPVVGCQNKSGPSDRNKTKWRNGHKDSNHVAN